MAHFVYKAPFGPITLYGEGDTLYRLTFEHGGNEGDASVFPSVVQELDKYFEGERKSFDIPLLPAPTPFLQKVREGMLHIPYGEVLPYGLVAESIGHPGAARAVGNACHTNPYPILVPCHRVVAAHSLGGFAGKEFIKRFLIELEQKNV